MSTDLPSSRDVLRHQAHRDKLASQLALLVSGIGRARNPRNLARSVLESFTENGRVPTAVAICSIATFSIFLRDLPSMERSLTDAPAILLGGLGLPIAPATLTLLDRASKLSRACALNREGQTVCRFSVLEAYPFCPVVTCTNAVCFLFSSVIFVASINQVYGVIDRLNELGRSSHLIACHLSVAPSPGFFTDLVELEMDIYEMYDTRSGEIVKSIHLWIRAVCEALLAETQLNSNNSRDATTITTMIVKRRRAATRLSELRSIAPVRDTEVVVSKLRTMLNPPRRTVALLLSAYFPAVSVERMARESGVGPTVSVRRGRTTP